MGIDKLLQAQFRPAWQRFLALLVIGLATWLPRGLALDRLVTPDEPTWLTNSANYYLALAQGDLAQTYQIEHPGVTVMWAGTAGFLWRYPDYIKDGPRQFEWWLEEAGPFLKSHGHEPLEILVASRYVMTLAITLILMAAFWTAARLLGFWPAFTGFLFIATDPFHVAHARLLHLDGLASSLALLSLLAFMNHLYKGGGRFDLSLSAGAAGLAWLTKSPTLFLIPFIGLLIILDLVIRKRSQTQLARQDWIRAGYTLVGWGATGLAVFVLLWPAMWVEPVYTVWRVLRATVGYAAKGHEAATFFNGAIVDGDPGALFYPVTYLWRTTPLTLAGLGWVGAALILGGARFIPAGQRRPLAGFLLFAALFTLFMSLGAKKFDRYLLPVYAPLNLAAAVGWVSLLRWFRSRRHGAGGWFALAGLFILAGGQIYSLAAAYPYYLSYYNPLLGGTKRAPAVMMVGWGEGMDQAARYLNNQPGAEDLQVATGVWNGAFSYFFKGRIHGSNFEPGNSILEEWTSSDYFLIYINQWQRGRLPAELLDHLVEIEPALVVRLQGLAYVLLYDLREAQPPTYLLRQPISLEEGAGLSK